MTSVAPAVTDREESKGDDDVDTQPVTGSKVFHNVRYSSGSISQTFSVDHEYFLRNYSPDSQGEPVPTPILTSVRFRLAVVCWFGMAVMYAQRTNLSIAMVCMAISETATTNGSIKHALSDQPKCPELEHSEITNGFDWDSVLQGQILGSFFYGYLVLQLPGGMLSERLGAKTVITVGMLPVAVLTLLTPVLTHVHYILLIVIRVILGLGQAVMYPAITALWAKWAPPMERTMLIGLSLSGGQFGNALVLPVGGLLCAYVNWETIFYATGGFGLLFCIIWMLWVSATPDEHKGLSIMEKIYLQRSIPTVDVDVPHATPWKAIFTSRPVWAIIAAHTLGNYTYYMNMTQMPTYMKVVLKFNIKSNGAFSMMPYLVFWLSMMGAGVLSDAIIHRNVSMVVVRKVLAFMGLMGPAAFMVVTAFLDCTLKYVAVFTLCCAVGMTGFGFASYMVNHGDLAPDFAGTLFGISNTLATLPGFVAPIIVGAMTPDGTVTQWRSAFFVAASINGLGALIYVLLASADIQPWSSAKFAKDEVKVERTCSAEKLAKIKEIYQIGMKDKGKKNTIRRLSGIPT